MTPEPERQPIEAYLPHRGAMLFIDRLIEWSDEHAVSEVVVPADGLFVRDGGMPAWVGLEYMAQTIASWAGARARQRGSPVRIGLLLGTRRYEAKRSAFPCRATLRIEVRSELVGDNGLGVFDCRIVQAGEPVVSAKVSVFEPEDGAAILINESKSIAHD